MRYNCDDIKYYLDHGDKDPESPQDFLNHIDNCQRCSRIIGLEPELEETFALFAPETLPVSLEENILTRIMKFEKELGEEKRMEKLLIPIVGFFSALPIFLVAWFWKDIRSFFNSPDLTYTYNNLSSFILEIPIPEIDLAGIVTAIANSPPIILSLITITSLVWAFSIIEAQKTLK
ncbi:MAG: hypothetical protein JSW64_04355 [Candidatus Zixiibacteriota bacterium]|nr:MAG: hypothetical protein JSW64_04355 [candidate division Zixibacteria bacterium]